MIWIFVIGWLALCSLIGLSVDTSLNMDKRTNWKNSLSLCLQSFRVQTLKYSLFFQLNLHSLYFCSYLLLYTALQRLEMWNCFISVNCNSDYTIPSHLYYSSSSKLELDTHFIFAHSTLYLSSYSVYQTVLQWLIYLFLFSPPKFLLWAWIHPCV